MQKFDHNIGFGEKHQFFAENCGYNMVMFTRNHDFSALLV
jgi:hypothetical protein